MVIITAILLGMAAIAGDLEIQVKGLRAPGGGIAVAVFPESQAGGFPDEATPSYRAYEKLSGAERTAKIKMPGVKPGTYAIALYQDENGDQKLGRDVLGIPSEPFGFSEDPRIYFGAPSFKRSSFKVTEQPMVLEINLKTF